MTRSDGAKEVVMRKLWLRPTIRIASYSAGLCLLVGLLAGCGGKY
jgi:hypothetical protein